MSAPTDQRQQVFARIREALRRPAPHFHGAEAGDDPGAPSSDAFRAWLPPVGSGQEEQIALFLENSIALRTEVHRVPTLEEVGRQLAALAAENKWQQIAAHRHELVLALAEKLPLPCLVTDAGYATMDLEKCDAGITACDALVAQTGSILVSASSAGGRALSVLPPHHIVVVRANQIVPDLATALRQAQQRYAPNWPSSLSFITGPSRTGDIERILVLGAHGPKRLTVFLLD
jgi:L-lactate dehydrogenase complex protein LldG